MVQSYTMYTMYTAHVDLVSPAHVGRFNTEGDQQHCRFKSLDTVRKILLGCNIHSKMAPATNTAS